MNIRNLMGINIAIQLKSTQMDLEADNRTDNMMPNQHIKRL